MHGLRFSDGSELVARALAAVEERPRSTEELARRVFGFRDAPPALAARLLFDLLSDERRLEVDDRGVWSLAAVGSGGQDRELRGLDYVVVDVETTGSSPRTGARVIEVAAVEVTAGRVTGEFGSLVNPGVPVPRWISRLTGISDEMLVDAPRFEEIADLVRERLEGRIFVAHNAGFDWRFVAAEMKRARSLLPSGPRLCTLRLARRALPGLPRRGLDALADFYGIEIEDRHRAGGDALATAGVLMRLLAEADRRGVRRWSQLQAWLDGRVPAPGQGRVAGEDRSC